MPKKISKRTKKNIFIISGPSGAGKDAVISGLKKILPSRQLITTTSRPKRPGERQGKPYYFMAKNEFKKRIRQKEFFEYDKHYDNYYGLTHKEIDKTRKGKKIYFWQAEYKGVITAKKQRPDIIAIFINSPFEILKKRILARKGKLNKKIFSQRIKDIKEWLKRLDLYDYIVKNEEGRLNQTIAQIVKIIKKNAK